MKKLILLLTICFSLQLTMNAQSEYKSAIGVRLGGYYDLFAGSYKFFITDPGAIELNLGIRPFGAGEFKWTVLSFSASYQHHFPIGNVAGLQWYVGGGPTIYTTFSNFDDYKGFGAVIFATGGVDYKFANIPLNVSADIRPGFSITGLKYYNPFTFTGGVAARYTLN